MKMNQTQLYNETSKAFKQLVDDFDKDAQWVYTFEAKSMLDRLENKLTRLYENNCLSLKDFERFDAMLFKRQANIFE